MDALQQSIQLFNENNYYRQYLQQQTLLWNIQLLHQSQPIFTPARASIIDMVRTKPQSHYKSFRSSLLSDHASASTEIPDISKFQIAEPMLSMPFPPNLMTKEFKWPKEQSKNHDDHLFQNTIGRDPNNLSFDDLSMFKLVNPMSGLINPGYEEKIKPIYDNFGNYITGYKLTPDMKRRLTFVESERQGFRGFNRLV